MAKETTKEALKRVLGNAASPIGPVDAAEEADKNYNTVRAVLRQMFNQGEVAALNDSTYCLPGQFPEVISRVGIQGQPSGHSGDGARHDTKKPAPSEDEAGEVPKRSVPVFTDVSAGPGIVPAKEAKKRVQIPEAEYQRVFGAPALRNPQRFGYCEVRGSSAVPIYFDGELVPVEIIGPTQAFTSEGVYIFRWLGDLRLKQLVKHPLKEGQREEMDRMEEDCPEHRVEMRSLDVTQGKEIVEPTSCHDFAVLARVIQTQKQQLYSRAMRQIFDGKLSSL